MKLYQFDLAPASKRVNLFLAETGIEVPVVQLNVRDGDQFEEPYNSLNPFHCIPLHPFTVHYITFHYSTFTCDM